MASSLRDFADRLRVGSTLIGTVVSLPSPEIAEMAARAGFDWLFVDAEHGPLSRERVQHILQAAAPCACVVRVPGLDPVWIAQVLDAGAHGVLVPRVASAAEVSEAVRAAKYPPQGDRGVGVARAQGYGVDLAPYLSSANDATVLMVQVEHREAVERIEEIVAVPGLDAVLVGPYDLSASMGRPGEVHDAEVRDAIARVLAACTAAEVAAGVFAATPDAARALLDEGYTVLAVGTDALMLTTAFSHALHTVRNAGADGA